MHYIIGPERSAEALARKFGLRREEWKRVGSAADVALAPVFGEHNRFLVTHDAWQLGDYDQIMMYARDLETLWEQDIIETKILRDG